MKHTAAILILTLPALAILGEEELLDTYDSVFRTSPEVLCIETAQGDTITFRNDPAKEDIHEAASYFLIGYLPDQNFWSVEMHGYEWMQWEVVSGNNGTTTTTIGPPVPSPDGTRLLCFMEDIMAGFIHNGIQIWKIGEDDSLTLEFEDLDVPWGPKNGQWQSSDTIVFEKLTYDYDTYEYHSRPGKLKLTEMGTWEPPDLEGW